MTDGYAQIFLYPTANLLRTPVLTYQSLYKKPCANVNSGPIAVNEYVTKGGILRKINANTVRSLVSPLTNVQPNRRNRSIFQRNAGIVVEFLGRPITKMLMKDHSPPCH